MYNNPLSPSQRYQLTIICFVITSLTLIVCTWLLVIYGAWHHA